MELRRRASQVAALVGPTRRTFLGGGAAIAALGIGAAAFRGMTTSGDEQVDEFLASRPFTVAHRGSELDWPEMTDYAYSRSVAAGARALEMSVARTSDGVWFGLHDTTLDRTSRTSGYVAADHTWAEIGEHSVSAAATRFPTQPSRPYLRLDDFLRRYVPGSVVFIDPKGVDPAHYPELVALLQREVSDPSRSIIAKSDAGNVAWATAGHRAGLRTWGFYYGSELALAPTLLARTHASWDLLGLDWSATPGQWAEVNGVGKPVIGHVIATESQRAIALDRGAVGVIVSDLLRVAP